MNYSSIEDSEHGKQVLQSLVDNSFVQAFTDYGVACRHLGLKELANSKLALVTTVKD